jgi:Protein kinase domain
VWRATNHATKEVHALKVVFWGNPDVKEHHRKILQKEVQILKELDHPHIVKLIEAQESRSSLILVLEYLKGGGLLENLFEVEHYTEAQAAHLFQQILSAVAYMHSLNIMHRDIKPENIVFKEPVSSVRVSNEQPMVKIVDFGLARHYSSQRSVKARLGSPGFMAPEVCCWCVRDEAPDVRARVAPHGGHCLVAHEWECTWSTPMAANLKAAQCRLLVASVPRYSVLIVTVSFPEGFRALPS